MDAMPHGDDLDARFNELVSQIDAEEQRKMRASAVKGVKAPPEARRPRRARRGLLAATAVTAVIAAAGLVVSYRPDLLAPSPVRQASSAPPPEETQPVVEKPQQVGPFTDSKAEHFADGMAGFQTPKAKALAGSSKAEVKAGLAQARKLFETAYLNHKILMGGKPAAFIRLLPQDERAWYRKHQRIWVHSFAPKTAELATDVIKVHGTTTLDTKKVNGRSVAVVRTNYIVVYAIQRPGQPSTVERLVTHPRGEIQLLHEGGRLVVWVRRWGGSATPARCDTRDGFIHPVYDDSAPDTVHPTGPPQDPYELDEPEGHGCSTSTGT